MFRKRPAPATGFDVSKIDLVTVSPDGGAVQLHVVRDAPWTGSDEPVAGQGLWAAPTGFAATGVAVLQILSWVFVAILLAGVTGLLKRQ
jgi:hypothetical protein